MRLATIIARLEGTVSGPDTGFHQPKFVVQSADGEDRLESNDPQVFARADVPARVGEVTMNFGLAIFDRYPVVCNLQLKAGRSGKARLEVAGTDPTQVTGVFGELDRQMVAAREWGGWLNRANDAIWPEMLLSVPVVLLGVVALVAAESLVLRLAGIAIADVGVVWLGVLATLDVMGSLLMSFWLFIAAQRAFPVVEFAGKLSDELTGYRRRLVFLGLAIVCPIIANGLYDALKGVFAR